MIGAFLCHIPSGGSLKQFSHFLREINFGYFGKYVEALVKPPDFPLHLITAPLSLHYSTVDQFTNPTDVRHLIPRLNNSIVFVQTLNDTNDKYNHVDFIWGKHAKDDIYSQILKFFKNY